MRNEQISSAMALAEISRAALGPYEAYQQTLRFRHEATGVTREALSREAAEGKLFRDFVSRSVQLLPAAEITHAVPRRLDEQRFAKPRIAFDISDHVCSFATGDSVKAETLWSSVAWLGSVPHYPIGKDGARYLFALPRIRTAPQSRVDRDIEEAYGTSGLRDLAMIKAEKLAARAALSMVNKARSPKFCYNTVALRPGATFEIRDNYLEGKMPDAKTPEFWQLASSDTSERTINAQTELLRSLYDVDQNLFILNPSAAPRRYQSLTGTPEEQAPERISGRTLQRYHVLERLTVLAVRFSVLDAYTYNLGRLYQRISGIRDTRLTLHDATFEASDTVQHIADHLTDMLRAACETERQKAQQSPLRRILGLGSRPV